MRDLTRAHLPLWRNIKAKVEETVKEKYGVDKGKLRLYVHYQPTYCMSFSLSSARIQFQQAT